MQIEIYKNFIAEAILIKGGNFIFKTLFMKNIKLTDEKEIYIFLELLSAFVSNHLEIEKEYKHNYAEVKSENTGYFAKIVSKNNNKYLLLIIDKKEYYLDKYECRIITKILNKILSKCIPREMISYER